MNPIQTAESPFRLSLVMPPPFDLPENVIQAENIANPDVDPPLLYGESIHIGYTPITEYEAFYNSVYTDKLALSHFAVPRGGSISAEKIIMLIRNVVLSTDELQAIIPKNVHFSKEPKCRLIYYSNLIYTCFDNYGNHRFAKFNISIFVSASINSSIVEAHHLIGDSRISMSCYSTIRDYVTSNGATVRRVPVPDFTIGFEDQYECAMQRITD
jgi:hypothetical protein